MSRQRQTEGSLEIVKAAHVGHFRARIERTEEKERVETVGARGMSVLAMMEEAVSSRCRRGCEAELDDVLQRVRV